MIQLTADVVKKVFVTLFEWALAFVWMFKWYFLLLVAVGAISLLARRFGWNWRWIGPRYYGDKAGTFRHSTLEAHELGERLRSFGWKVELEKWDGYKHIDIAITQVKVNIEVDGKQHGYSAAQALADLKRTFYSFKKGYVTLRIPNVLVRDSRTIEETAHFIDQFLRASEDQVNAE